MPSTCTGEKIEVVLDCIDGIDTALKCVRKWIQESGIDALVQPDGHLVVILTTPDEIAKIEKKFENEDGPDCMEYGTIPAKDPREMCRTYRGRGFERVREIAKQFEDHTARIKAFPSQLAKLNRQHR